MLGAKMSIENPEKRWELKDKVRKVSSMNLTSPFILFIVILPHLSWVHVQNSGGWGKGAHGANKAYERTTLKINYEIKYWHWQDNL